MVRQFPLAQMAPAWVHIAMLDEPFPVFESDLALFAAPF